MNKNIIIGFVILLIGLIVGSGLQAYNDSLTIDNMLNESASTGIVLKSYSGLYIVELYNDTFYEPPCIRNLNDCRCK